MHLKKGGACTFDMGREGCDREQHTETRRLSEDKQYVDEGWHTRSCSVISKSLDADMQTEDRDPVHIVRLVKEWRVTCVAQSKKDRGSQAQFSSFPLSSFLNLRTLCYFK